jgi:hypothetical protein
VLWGVPLVLQLRSKTLTRMRSWTGCQRSSLSIVGTVRRFDRYDERCRPRAGKEFARKLIGVLLVYAPIAAIFFLYVLRATTDRTNGQSHGGRQ